MSKEIDRRERGKIHEYMTCTHADDAVRGVRLREDTDQESMDENQNVTRAGLAGRNGRGIFGSGKS